jgi:hypothetical protein
MLRNSEKPQASAVSDAYNRVRHAYQHHRYRRLFECGFEHGLGIGKFLFYFLYPGDIGHDSLNGGWIALAVEFQCIALVEPLS